MTTEQQLKARELLTEAIQRSDDAAFNFRVLQFLDSLDYESAPQLVPIVIRDVVGGIQPIFGPRSDSPLNDYNGGPA